MAVHLPPALALLLGMGVSSAQEPTGPALRYPQVVTLTGGELLGVTNGIASYRAASGFVDGPRGVARLHEPCDLAFGPDGSLYVLDKFNGAIRVVTMDGTVTTLTGATAAAGAGERQSTAIETGFRDGPPGTAAFGRMVLSTSAALAPGITDLASNSVAYAIGPRALEFGPDGNLYVADFRNHVIRQVDLQGNVRTICGLASRDPKDPEGLTWLGVPGFRDGPPEQAQLNEPRDLAVGPKGTLYVLDANGLRELSPDGHLRTLIQGGAQWITAIAPDGTIYLHDGSSNLGKVAPDGRWIGPVVGGGAQTPWLSADRALELARGTFAPDGNAYLAHDYHSYISFLTPDDHGEPVLGGFGEGLFEGELGFRDGPAEVALFNAPAAIVWGPDGCFYVADEINHAIRKIIPRPPDRPWAPGDPDPLLPPLRPEITYPLVVSVYGAAVRQDGLGFLHEDPVQKAREPVSLTCAIDLEFAPDGALYVLDGDPLALYRVRLDETAELVVNVLHALDLDFFETEWRLFRNLGGLALSEDGRLAYIADTRTNQILGVDLATGSVTPFSGVRWTPDPNPAAPPSIQDGPPTMARFDRPTDLVRDPDGNLYVVDQGGIRRVTPTGDVTTLTTQITGTYITRAPDGALLMPSEGVYWKVYPDGKRQAWLGATGLAADNPMSWEGSGVGDYWQPVRGYCDGPRGVGGFRRPGRAVAVVDGYVYLLDGQWLRQVTPGGALRTILGDLRDPVTGAWYLGADAPCPRRDGSRGVARFHNPCGIAVGPDGALYVTDHESAVRRIMLGP